MLTISRSSPPPIPFISTIAIDSPRTVFPPTVLVIQPVRSVALILVIQSPPLPVPCIVVAQLGREPVGITVSSVVLLAFA
jgi:hypothetical protein